MGSFFIGFLGAFFLLSSTAHAFSSVPYVNECDGYQIALPKEWVNVTVREGSLSYQDGDLFFQIEQHPLGSGCSLEKWMVDESVADTTLAKLTIRNSGYKREKIAGIDMLFYRGDFTMNEGEQDELTFAMSSYIFVDQCKGYVVRLLSTDESAIEPDKFLQTMMRSFVLRD